MINVQEIFTELNPYITGMRYVDSIPVIDALFKEGWVIPKSKIINFERGETDKKYFMFYTEKEGIGFNEIIEYIKTIIKINIERELKVKLLKEKIVELKELFKSNTLEQLQNLRCSILSPDLVNEVVKEDELIDEYIDDTALINEINPPKEVIESDQKTESKTIITTNQVSAPVELPNIKEQLAPGEVHDGEPEYVSEIEGEFQKFDMTNVEPLVKGNKTEVYVEDDVPLPAQSCNCGPDAFCPVCATEKGY